MDISHKIVLVTGASGGIGAAIAKAISAAGADQVVLLARNEDALKQVVQAIEAKGGKARYYPVDLSDKAAVAAVSQRIHQEVGVPDILINNAGSGQWKFMSDTSDDDIEKMMALPYFAAAWLTRRFLPGMMQRGSGHILNVSSVASRMAWPGATAYISACRAMRGLSDALRADLSDTGVGVTHYESGPIDSTYWRNNPESRNRVPGIARMLIPVLTKEQVARAVVAGIRGNKRFIVIPRMLQLIYLLHFAFPWLVQWLMTITGYRLRKNTQAN